MQSKPVVIDRDSTLGNAARLMRRHKVNRLPVVEDGRLVGILTRQDVVEAVTGPGADQRPRTRPRYRRGPPTP